MSGFSKIQVVSDNGARIVMESTDTGYLLSNVDLGQPTEEDNTYRIPYCHGETYDTFRFGTRDITLNGHCFNGDFQRLEMAFSPFSFVTLTLNRGGVIRTARGKPYGVFKPNKNPPYDFTAVIRCYDPFFYEPEQVYVDDNGPIIIYNNGDAETPLFMWFLLLGNTESFEISLQTFENSGKQVTKGKISVEGLTYTTNKLININTADGDRYVRARDTTSFNYDDLSGKMTSDSTFFQLPPGRNILVHDRPLRTTVAMRYLEI